MGSLKDIANQPKLQTFPSSTYVIEGEPPESQCSEAKIEGDSAQTITGANTLIDSGKFIGFDLTGKVCHIIVSPTGNTGNFAITGNGDNFLFFATDPGNSLDVGYYVSNGGSLILTRTMPSFAQFIASKGFSYTIKGGKLYTNIPPDDLQPACSILFDPLT